MKSIVPDAWLVRSKTRAGRGKGRDFLLMPDGVAGQRRNAKGFLIRAGGRGRGDRGSGEPRLTSGRRDSRTGQSPDGALPEMRAGRFWCGQPDFPAGLFAEAGVLAIACLLPEVACEPSPA